MALDPMTPLLIAAVALLFGSGKKKKGKKKKTGDFEDTTKKKGKGKARPEQKKDKGSGSKQEGDPDSELGPDNLYDPDFYWGECGPGWVLEQEADGNEVCVWWSDYAAPADLGPEDLWIAPDCYSVIVGRDWWSNVAQEYVRDAHEGGLGGLLFLTDDMQWADEQWVESYEFLVYDLLSQYVDEKDMECIDAWPWHTSWGFYDQVPYPSQADYSTVEEFFDEDTQSTYEMEVLDDEAFDAAVAEWQAKYNEAVEAFMEEFELLGMLVDGLLKATSAAAPGGQSGG